jgi:nucleoside-diphosphate-sugar epimerase
LKILFIGGTGVISTACSELCVAKGYELYLLNRGESFRQIPEGAIHTQTDIHNRDNVNSLLKDHHFDVVVNWIAYIPEDVQKDYELFRDKTSQYIFISSASAYQKPPAIPLVESHLIYNPFWSYSNNKILCENYLNKVFEINEFPVTIVRPSHTYDKTKIPLHGGFTALNRLLKGKKIIIHGDGTSLWTLTHHQDFADGFVGLLGKQETIGEIYHVTGDEVLTWDQICKELAAAAGVEPNIIHIPSDFINQFDEEWGAGLLGDKAYSMIFDNCKIKNINPDYEAKIPFSDGAREMVEWHMSEKSHQEISSHLDKTMDDIISHFQSAFKR